MPQNVALKHPKITFKMPKMALKKMKWNQMVTVKVKLFGKPAKINGMS